MKRLTTTIAAAAVVLGALAMPTVTVAEDDDHKQTVRAMKKAFAAAKRAANRLPTFKDGAVVQWRGGKPRNLDYQSLGYWLEAGRKPKSRPNIGAWAAVPVDARAPELPVGGGAFYRGTAKGFVSQNKKTSPFPALANTRFEGTFTAPVILVADFEGSEGKQSINGCVGCAQGITFSGQYVRTENVAVDGLPPSGPMNIASSYSVGMAALLNADGTWRSNVVRLNTKVPNDPATRTGGAWGGRLIAGDQFPASAIGEKAVGTFGAWATEEDGDKTVLLGAFSTGPGDPAERTTLHMQTGVVTCTTINGPCN